MHENAWTGLMDDALVARDGDQINRKELIFQDPNGFLKPCHHPDSWLTQFNGRRQSNHRSL